MGKCVVGFAVVKVISGVFMHETFKVAGADDDLMIMEKEKMRRRHRTKMNVLLQEADSSGDAMMDWEEFQNVIEDSRIKTWLSAMELDVRDPRFLFDMLNTMVDDGDTVVSGIELAKGVSALRGPARSLDLAMVQRDIRDLLGKMTHLESDVVSLRQHKDREQQFLVMPAALANSNLCELAAEGVWTTQHKSYNGGLPIPDSSVNPCPSRSALAIENAVAHGYDQRLDYNHQALQHRRAASAPPTHGSPPLQVQAPCTALRQLPAHGSSGSMYSARGRSPMLK